MSFGLPRAGEGYFSPDGKLVVYQAYPVGYPFYQIYVQPLDDRTPRLVSTGRGRTTCSYFAPDGKSILFASSHTDPHVDITELKAGKKRPRGDVGGISGTSIRIWTSTRCPSTARD